MRGSTAISAALRSAAGIAAGLALGLALAGCSASQVFEKMPTELGGLPAGTPAAPTAPYAYPAVHDMPPPRATPAMSEEEQVKVEKELAVVRDRQEARTGTAKETAHTPKKKSTTGEKAPDAGAKDGAKTNP